MRQDLRDLYQEVILDHNRHPRNFHVMEQADCSIEGFNPLCGDKLTLYLRFTDNVITDASFVGQGCAISTASASLLTETIKGKTRDEAQKIFDAIHRGLTENNASFDSALGKLAILEGVKTYPTRVKCATLAWHTLRAALNQEVTVVSTE